MTTTTEWYSFVNYKQIAMWWLAVVPGVPATGRPCILSQATSKQKQRKRRSSQPERMSTTRTISVAIYWFACGECIRSLSCAWTRLVGEEPRTSKQGRSQQEPNKSAKFYVFAAGDIKYMCMYNWFPCTRVGYMHLNCLLWSHLLVVVVNSFYE